MKKKFIISFTANNTNTVLSKEYYAESLYDAKMRFWNNIGLMYKNVNIIN